MPSPTDSSMPSSAPSVSFREFVTLAAGLMAINALGIDTMLPALPDMARSLGLTHPNQQQWIMSSYILSFGVSQLVFGPLADRFGRRPLILMGLAMFVVTSMLASLATSFEMMIGARALQGVGAACLRVLAVAIIRDRYSGREMARVMSLTLIVFLGVPMIAPSVGQAVLSVGNWHNVFHFLALLGTILAIWLFLRLGETLRPEFRRPIKPRAVLAAARMVVADRASLGYTLGVTMSFSAVVGFINSSQQLFSVTFHAIDKFPYVFALAAGGMAMAAFVNSRIVIRLGSRMVSHSALIGYIILSGIHLISLQVFAETLITFVAFQMALMFCVGLMNANFGAMAMESMGAIAGSASSVQGAISTSGGAVIGTVIGQSFDGTSTPMVAGYFICSLMMLCAVLYAERGRLFRPQHPQH